MIRAILGVMSVLVATGCSGGTMATISPIPVAQPQASATPPAPAAGSQASGTPAPLLEPPTQIDPWTALRGFSVQVGDTYDLPYKTTPPLAWSLAPGQGDRVTLADQKLTANAPGAILLHVQSGNRKARIFAAAVPKEPLNDYLGPNTPLGGGPLAMKGHRIINTSEGWDKLYKSFFGAYRHVTQASPPPGGTPSSPGPTAPGAYSPPPPPPSTPHIDFTRHSLLVMGIDRRPYEGDVWLTQVTPARIEVVVTAAEGAGIEHPPVYNPYTLIRVLPKVSDNAEVQLSRMPTP